MARPNPYWLHTKPTGYEGYREPDERVEEKLKELEARIQELEEKEQELSRSLAAAGEGND